MSDAFTRQTIDSLGRLDIVIANAGIARLVPAEEITDEAWDEVVDTNLKGVWRTFRAAIPYIKRAGYGRLLATTSESGVPKAWEGHAHYTASKGGIVGLCATLAVELGPFGITVNSVAPGVVETPQSLDATNALGPDHLLEYARQIPVRRVGTADDVAFIEFGRRSCAKQLTRRGVHVRCHAPQVEHPRYFVTGEGRWHGPHS